MTSTLLTANGPLDNLEADPAAVQLAAAYLIDPKAQAAIVADMRAMAARLVGYEAGFGAGAPAGTQVSPSLLGSLHMGRDALAFYGMAADRVEQSRVYEVDAAEEPSDWESLVDQSPTYFSAVSR